MATALLLDDLYKRHLTEPGHPECPKRIAVIAEALEPLLARDVARIPPRRAGLDEIALCHDPRYVEHVLRVIEEGETDLANGDVSVSRESGEIALQAVGGVLNAVDAVLGGKAANAFCAVRRLAITPRPAAPMGFCLFGNVAIAARHAQKNHGIERVAIVDWDVHHGERDPRNLLFRFLGPVLLHAPVAVLSGLGPRIGKGRRRGSWLYNQPPVRRRRGPGGNFPRLRAIPAARARSLRAAAHSGLCGVRLPAGRSAGDFRLVDEDFADLTGLLLDAAARHCGGRLGLVLEGGYNLRGLGLAAKAHVERLIA